MMLLGGLQYQEIIINMITFYEGKFTFTLSGDLNKFYTEKGFAQKITKLLNGGF